MTDWPPELVEKAARVLADDPFVARGRYEGWDDLAEHGRGFMRAATMRALDAIRDDIVLKGELHEEWRQPDSPLWAGMRLRRFVTPWEHSPGRYEGPVISPP